MRFLHTADWHLGRLFHGVHLTRDQEHVLGQLIDLVAEARPDAVLLAGDVYDRAVPPVEAVELLNHVCEQVVLRLGVPLLCIAGNHDSGSRLGFAAGLLGGQGLHVAGRVAGSPPVVTLRDGHGPVHVCLLPFADPAEARAAYGHDALHDQQAVVGEGVARALAGLPAGERRLALAHTFVAGGEPSESERPLSVGGATEVAAATFAGFDYVALGHLHRPQAAGGGRLRYAGSLLKYSFDEHDQRKSVALVEVGPPGSAAEPGRPAAARVTVETVALAPRHDVRRLEGTLAGLLAAAARDPRRDDYVLAVLSDEGELYDPLGRLREAYPNVLAIERPQAALPEAGQAGRARRAASDLELYAGFHEYVTGAPAGDDALAEVARVLAAVERRRREAGPSDSAAEDAP